MPSKKSVYIPHRFHLSKLVKKRLSDFMKQETIGSWVSIKITPVNMKGDDLIMLSPTNKKNVDKAMAAGKNVFLKLSRAQLRQTVKAGGSFDLAMKVVAPLQSLAKKLLDPTVVDALDAKLAKLRGQGVKNPDEDMVKLLDIIERHRYNIFKPRFKEDLRASGISSDNLDAIKNGFLYSFADPKKGLELAGRLFLNLGAPMEKEEMDRQYNAGAEKAGYRTGKVNSSENSAGYLSKYA